jgi:ubiquinone/menaquinone biosynthesis C-methylase UbiE
LPFADASFDGIVCANSFHYFRQPRRALEQLHRVLRPGGQLILVDWCDDYWSCKLCSLWLRWTDPAFFRTYSMTSCRQLLTETGFLVQAADRYRINWLWGLMRLVCRRIETSDMELSNLDALPARPENSGSDPRYHGRPPE